MKDWKCPLFETDCPYCDENGICWVGNPAEECDDYAAAMGYDDPEEDE